MEKFSLWLEFEEYAGAFPGPQDDPACDFCNIHICLDSVMYAANVWTFTFLEQARSRTMTGAASDTRAQWLLPPDLLVETLDRATITLAVRELIADDRLPESWLVSDT